MKTVSKKFLSVLLAVCMVISMFPLTVSAAPAGKSWQFVGESGLSGDGITATSPQMVVDSGGTPYVAYEVGSGDYNLKVKKYDGDTWTALSDYVGSGWTIMEYSLAVNDSGVPYVAYVQQTECGIKLAVSKYNSSNNSWGNVLYQPFTEGSIPGVSLAFDSSGTPCVAYIYTNNGNRSLKVWKCGDSQDSYSSIGDSILDVKDNVTLAFDDDDTPYVAFRTTSNYVCVEKIDGNAWNPIASAPNADRVAFIVGADNKLYLEYLSNNTANIYQYESSQWTSISNHNFRDDVNSASNISLSEYNGILYASSIVSGETKVLQYGEIGWELIGEHITDDDDSADILAVSDDGTPYLAYMDTNGKISVKNYVSSSCTITYDSGAHGKFSDNTAAVKTETLNSGESPASVPDITPDNGYVFAGWSCDGGTTKYTNVKLVAQTISASVTYTAYYTKSFSGNAVWQLVGNAGFSGNSAATSPQMVVSSSGTPYVTYRSDDVWHTAMYNSGTNNWGSIGSNGYDLLSFAIGSDNTLYKAHVEDGGAPDSYVISVQKYVSGQWLAAQQAFLDTTDTPNAISLAIDHNGMPYVACSTNNGSGNYTLHVYKSVKDSPVLVPYPSDLSGGKDDITLAFNNENRLFVAYRDADNKPQLAWYGVEWIPVAGYSSLYGAGVSGMSLALGSDGISYVAYSPAAANNSLLVYKCNYNSDDASWEQVGSVIGSGDASSSNISSFSLANNGGGTLYLAQASRHNGSTPYVNSSVYTYDTNDGNSDWRPIGGPINNQRVCSAAFDGEGIPYLALLDASNKLSVMKLTEHSACTVTYSAGLHGTLNGAGSETVEPGSSPTKVPTAKPNDGYTFTGWSSDGGKTMLTAEEIKGETISANVTYTACYIKAFPANMAWKAVGSAGFSASETGYVSFVLAGDGTPYVAYADAGNSGKLTVMKYAAGGWQKVGSVGFSKGMAKYVSLKLDSKDTPYVAYEDVSNNYKATVMKYEGGSWTAVGSADGISGYYAYSISLAFDSKDTPYVAYYDNNLDNSGDTVMKYENGGWTVVGKQYFSAGQGATTYNSLAFDSHDTPYVAYSDADNGKVMKYTAAGGWTAVGSAGFSEGQANFESLAFDGRDTPYVAYSDIGSDGKATVRKYEGGSWTTVGIKGFSSGTANNVALATDSCGTPYVAYKDLSKGLTMVMRYEGESWKSLGSASSGEYISLAFDSHDTPYMAYMDNSSGNKATVMSYVEIPSVTVTYKAGANGKFSDNTTADKTETVASGGKPKNVPEIKPNDGYKFAGWSSDGGMNKYSASDLETALPVTANITYTAYYTQDQVSGFNVGGIRYWITGDSTVQVISNSVQYSGNAVIPAQVSYAGKNYNVTAVGGYAFNGCTGLTSVTIPNSVTSIGEGAFKGCSGLTSVNIPSGVTLIAASTFEDCASLTSVIIPSGVETIKEDAFYKCTGLSGSLTIPSTVKEIGENAFYKCTGLTGVTISSGVETIGDDAFRECTGLTNVAIPSTVKSLGGAEDGMAFDSCTNLAGFSVEAASPYFCSVGGVLFNKAKTELVEYPGGKSGSYSIPSGVTTIGEVSFANCKLLTGITIPSGVTSIGSRAFAMCGLTSVIIPSGVTSISDYAFTKCTHLTNVTIPSGVTSISDYAFAMCTGLTNVTIPSGVTSIGDYAFGMCTGLTNVTIPPTVNSIGEAAFCQCSVLASVDIPSSVTSFGMGAFAGCDSLTEATIRYPGLPDLPDTAKVKVGVFTSCKNLKKVYVPSSALELYKAHYADLGVKSADIIAAISGDDSKFTDGSGITYEITGTNPNRVKVISKENHGEYSGSVTIPANVSYNNVTYSVTEIGASAFSSCGSLTSVTLPGSITAIDTNAFSDCLNLSSINIPSGVALIDSFVFLNCKKLTGITIPSGVTAIANGAFFGCSGLTRIDIPSNVSSIGNFSFKNCTGLTEITIPASVHSVGAGAFLGCAALTKATFLGTVLPGLPDTAKGTTSVFSGCSQITVYVPASALDLYKAHYADLGIASADKIAAVSTDSGSHSSGKSSDTPKKTASDSVTRVDPAGNTATVTTQPGSVTVTGNTAAIEATVSTVTADTTGTNTSLDTGKKSAVQIDLPKDAVMQQLAAKKDVDLTITVPSEVAKDANSNVAVTIAASKDILAAAKASAADLTIKIKDADTQQLAYSWTFKGEDLAKSTAPVTDVNISMAVRLTTEVPQVNKVTPQNTGLVLMFDHSGTLPSTASVTFSAKEKGFQPGQTLYFYYYNSTTGQIEAQGRQYTVDADGNVTVQITHCSNYVLLPHSARTITLDTRIYTVNPGGSYVTGVKLTGVSGAKIKAYSSAKGVAAVTVLKNGNVKATGVKSGSTYIMIDVYDSKNKFLTHASVLLTVQKAVKPSGSSARQYGLF